MIGPVSPVTATGTMLRPVVATDAVDASRAVAARASGMSGSGRGETAERVDPPPPADESARMQDGLQADDGTRGGTGRDVGPDSPAGPPPTFKITILERERLRAAEPPDPATMPAPDATEASAPADESVEPQPSDDAAATPDEAPDRRERADADDRAARADAGFTEARRVLSPKEPAEA